MPAVEGSLRLDDPAVEPARLAGVRRDQMRPFSRVVDPGGEHPNASRPEGAGAVIEFLRQEAPLEFERMQSVGRLPATG